MSTPLPRLTRYELLGRLATGGMAEVYLGRSLGVAGFEKLVVVKTILPNLANDPTFTAMFINEARLAARLNHPNCVQIFDLGQENGILYIAMEYIEGFSLSRVLKRAKEKGLPPNEKIIARIAMDACSGLDYAHRLTERDGTPLKLVHRDISPDNLLIALSGQTRVVDFGIAKAATPQVMAAATVAGTVKGKHGFIAPEYLLGQPIDGRADLFALGVVMYRALTRKRPFGGANEGAVSLAVVQDTPPPPHAVNPAISEALSAVVMLALEKNPGNRFESARTMRAAIEKAVGRPADVEEVADFMSQLWPPGDEERTALNSLATGMAEDRSGPLLQSLVSGTWAGQNATPGTGQKVVVHATPPTAEEMRDQLIRRSGNHPPVGGPGGASGDFVETIAPPPTRAPAVPTETVALQSRPAAPAVVAFETPQFDPPKRGPSVVVIVLAMLVAGVGGGLGWQWWSTHQQPAQADSAPVTPPAVVVENAAPLPTAEATLVIEPPVSAHVVDGKDDLGTTPLTLKRPPGTVTFHLVNKSLGLDQAFKFTLEPGSTTKVDTLGRGALVVKAEPWAYVKVDGKTYGQTPVTVKGLYEGPHTIELNNVGLNETRRKTVRVTAGDTKTVSVNLLEEDEGG